VPASGAQGCRERRSEASRYGFGDPKSSEAPAKSPPDGAGRLKGGKLRSVRPFPGLCRLSRRTKGSPGLRETGLWRAAPAAVEKNGAIAIPTYQGGARRL